MLVMTLMSRVCVARRAVKRAADDEAEQHLQESCVKLLMRHQNTSELLLEITVSLRRHPHSSSSSQSLKTVVGTDFRGGSYFCNGSVNINASFQKQLKTHPALHIKHTSVETVRPEVCVSVCDVQ